MLDEFGAFGELQIGGAVSYLPLLDPRDGDQTSRLALGALGALGALAGRDGSSAVFGASTFSDDIVGCVVGGVLQRSSCAGASD